MCACFFPYVDALEVVFPDAFGRFEAAGAKRPIDLAAARFVILATSLPAYGEAESFAVHGCVVSQLVGRRRGGEWAVVEEVERRPLKRRLDEEALRSAPPSARHFT